MKSILLSIKSKYVAKILNGEKTIEVRKKFPKDYKGWVYIYCTKGKPYLFESNFETEGSPYECSVRDLGKAIEHIKSKSYYGKEYLGCPFVLHGTKYGNLLERRTYKNGKVVARLYCDKVDMPFLKDITKESCLTLKELIDYLEGKPCNAIHISQLEIFDKPKELSEFHKIIANDEKGYLIQLGNVLTKAPQNYCYGEVEE